MSRIDTALRYGQILVDAGDFTPLDKVADAIVVTTPELARPGPIIVHVNPAFERMSGYTLDQIVGESPRMLQGFDTDMAELARLSACLARGDSFEGEIVNYRRGGQEYLMAWAVVPVRDASGALRNWLSVQNDLISDARLARARERSHTGGEPG